MSTYEGWSYEEIVADIDKRVETGDLEQADAIAVINDMSEARYYLEAAQRAYPDDLHHHEHMIGRAVINHQITIEEAYELIDDTVILADGDIDGSA